MRQRDVVNGTRSLQNHAVDAVSGEVVGIAQKPYNSTHLSWCWAVISRQRRRPQRIAAGIVDGSASRIRDISVRAVRRQRVQTTWENSATLKNACE